MMSIHEAIERVYEKEPLFANMVTRLKVVEDNDNCPTLGTDGEHLFWNSEYWKTLKPPEMCGVVLHEVFHCAFRHIWRREERHMDLWNIATDYAINTVVNESFPLPKGALLDMKYYGMSAEEIYDSFPKSKKRKGKGDESEQGWCDKSGWKSQVGKMVKDSIIGKVLGKKPTKGTMTESEREAMWKKLFDETFLKNYGKLPMSLQRIISKAYYVPVVDWSSLVQNLLSEDFSDYTFSMPDRRFMEYDFILPSMHSVDSLKDIVFAYDTSGSITDDDLKAYYMETLSLFSNFSSLQGWIAICDARLHHFNEVNPQQGYEDFKFMGGGGTDFRPVFQEINTRGMRPKALFYFTDCAGSYPIEKPEFPVFWLVRSPVGRNYPLNVPFGTVIRFLA